MRHHKVNIAGGIFVKLGMEESPVVNKVPEHDLIPEPMTRNCASISCSLTSNLYMHDIISTLIANQPHPMRRLAIA